MRLVGAPIHVNQLPPAGPGVPRLHNGHERADRFGGLFRIRGTVTVEDVPGQRRIVLIDRRTLRLFRSTWSSVDGSYRFDWIRDADVLVVGLDYTRVHNDVIYAAEPEPMPS